MQNNSVILIYKLIYGYPTKHFGVNTHLIFMTTLRSLNYYSDFAV